MSKERKGLGIVFHSGSYDRLCHGLTIALTALGLDRDVRFFFTYWALEYLKRGEGSLFKVDGEGQAHIETIRENLEKGHGESVSELIRQTKALGARFYVCTHSMSLLNISEDELIDEVDRNVGLTTFLTETAEDQMLFV